ncbi:MAG TPA: energy transducer TonB [Pyrinomonadaceae bacterium]|nr:energy transducer TonB [Pyrinomonadaceae bacterium]
MRFRRLQWALAIIFVAAIAVSGQVQKSATDWADWETISPDGEEFTVSMPKNPTTEATTFPYHKMELKARLYLAKSPAGATLAIASLSGIKSDPSAYSDFARFNSYVDAFKDFFPPKVRTKETALTKLTLVSSRPFQGHSGRFYKIAIGELNGVAHAFATRKRFYVVVSLNTKKDEAIEEKFLSSFMLPERQPDPPKVAAAPNANANAEQPLPENAEQANENPTGQALKQEAAGAVLQVGNESHTDNPTSTVSVGGAATSSDNTKKPENNQPKEKRPINGGMLNGKAIYLPQPMATGEATGVVMVQVLIDESGSVIDARAVSGPQHLHAAAVTAARLARFTPTTLMGEPVKVAGTISYNFGRSN